MSSSSFPFIPNEFIGKRALVTGGTQGMGEAIVDRLARGGARIVTTARSTPQPLCALTRASSKRTSARRKAAIT